MFIIFCPIGIPPIVMYISKYLVPTYLQFGVVYNIDFSGAMTIYG